MKGTIGGICVLGSIALVGCRTPVVPRPLGTVARPDVTAQLVALSNEVGRLNQKMESLEREWHDLKSSVQFMMKLVDEEMCQPVVEESLIGVPDKNGR